jgi:hypothetical protein
MPKPVCDIPADNKQYNFTDPESGIMKASNRGWDQRGNAQAAVDSANQIIVACDVTGQSNDKQQFEPMLEQAQDNIGQDKKIKAAWADSGYYSESNVKFAEDKQIDVYIATRRMKHNDPVPKPPRGRPPKEFTVQEKMTWKLRTKKGRETYSKRKSIVEPAARPFNWPSKNKSYKKTEHSRLNQLLGQAPRVFAAGNRRKHCP